MKSSISAELLKLRTTRAIWVAAAVALIWSLAGPVLVAVAPKGASVPPVVPSTLADVLRGPAVLAGGAMLLVGLLAAAGEFRHGTVLTTRLVQPRASRALGAKLAALAAAGLAVGVVMDVVSGSAGAILLASRGVSIQPLSHGVPQVAVLVPVLLAVHAAMGVAVGSLLRSTAAAVGTTMVWVFVVEGAVPVLLRRPELTHWLPGGTVPQILAEQATPGQLAPAAAGLLLIGYVVVLLGAVAAVDRVREL
jgi:ABC-2 type transport system permease protein